MIFESSFHHILTARTEIVFSAVFTISYHASLILSKIEGLQVIDTKVKAVNW